MKILSIKTSKQKAVIDITNLVNDELSHISIQTGLCFLFLTHTTCALTTADLDPGTDLDMLDAFSEFIPKLQFQHPHKPEHAPDHILSYWHITHASNT